MKVTNTSINKECEEEIDDNVKETEETIGYGRDEDGGKILENAAFTHDNVEANPGGPPVLANSLLNFFVTVTRTKIFSTLVGC
ncbi:hypothetical protein DAPPUDRAFT_248600 [Daphnia pulex]|uniref:Uncharacterized protein n=1 Tax=Daphnia pulex TaxID=6669 RepID=E9GUH2_DAPPU|nr:hypothetical protein DAPPUDRAFT_248600 [Daphnia pulex]|eukprot:EFX76830.1 hypothetical protein DAPPUDRAFT_248600 [Daphnia pulex]